MLRRPTFLLTQLCQVGCTRNSAPILAGSDTGEILFMKFIKES